MKNAEKFKSIFGLYATELWSMDENDMLKWLNAECEEPERNVGMWRITGKEVGAMGIEYLEKTCTSCGWVHSLPIPENYCPRCGHRNT